MRKLSQAEIATAQKNWREFCERSPKAAAELRLLIEGTERLGDDPRLVRHFAETTVPPTRSELVALSMTRSMAEIDSDEFFPSIKSET